MRSAFAFTGHLTVDIGSNATYALTADDVTILAGADCLIDAWGSTLTVKLSGAGDVVYLGGNGVWARRGSDDLVSFAAPGTLHERTFSNVEVNANHCRLTMGGDDTLTVYGAGDKIIANGTGDTVWVGRNGSGAARADVDFVQGLAEGTLFELPNSQVSVTGRNYSAAVTGNDVLTATGSSVSVSVSGAGNVVNIGGNPMSAGADDLVTLTCGGVVNEMPDTFLTVWGDNAFVHAAGRDALALIGAGDAAVLAGDGNRITVGQNDRRGAPADVVIYGYSYASTFINVLPDSNVQAQGDNGAIWLGGGDRLFVNAQQGQSNIVSDLAGGNTLTLSGGAQATLMAGDKVFELSNSSLSLKSARPASNGEFRVSIDADDQLAIAQGFSVYVPVLAGTDTIFGFGPTDVLHLASRFCGLQGLLDATTEIGGNSTVALDSAGDTLTLANVAKATFAAYAQQGLVRYG